MPTETRILFDLALVVFILAVIVYATIGPSGPRR
jgi:hypothetical protein